MTPEEMKEIEEALEKWPKCDCGKRPNTFCHECNKPLCDNCGNECEGYDNTLIRFDFCDKCYLKNLELIETIGNPT